MFAFTSPAHIYLFVRVIVFILVLALWWFAGAPALF